ncbi:hypothetical protein VNO78_35271 [Psophocarpus tetragonolobus]|uniref:Uncharacterized protein n=1 Tax=Psophocarpus tetragonolobus TaxID=3891 RepID=A0AAN9NP11_PSOTE
MTGQSLEHLVEASSPRGEFGLDNPDPLYTMNEIPMRESRAKEDLRLVLSGLWNWPEISAKSFKILRISLALEIDAAQKSRMSSAAYNNIFFFPAYGPNTREEPCRSRKKIFFSSERRLKQPKQYVQKPSLDPNIVMRNVPDGLISAEPVQERQEEVTTIKYGSHH